MVVGGRHRGVPRDDRSHDRNRTDAERTVEQQVGAGPQDAGAEKGEHVLEPQVAEAAVAATATASTTVDSTWKARTVWRTLPRRAATVAQQSESPQQSAAASPSAIPIARSYDVSPSKRTPPITAVTPSHWSGGGRSRKRSTPATIGITA